MAMPAPTSISPRAAIAWKALRTMRLMREVEDRIERKLYRQGKILGGVYVGRGQEAIPVGFGLRAEPDDVLFPSHRDMALFFLRGVTPGEVFAQYMGREDGLTRGRDGNMHMGDMKRGLVAIISAMAASVPVAAGAALAIRYRGGKQVVFNFTGDGATSRGDWHEGINFAAVKQLPLVLVTNNNQYAYSTPVANQMACSNVADRAPGYGIPAEIVDGNNVLDVYDAAGRAVAHARSGKGPYLVECKTFRMTGHSAHDGADYVPRELFAAWEKKDPIRQLERTMTARRWADSGSLAELEREVRQEVDAAVEWAEARPYPDPAGVLRGVYAGEESR